MCVLAAVALGAALVGCQQSAPEVADVQSRLSRLGRLYGMYLGSHGGKSVKSLQEFKAFAKQRVTNEQLEQLGLASLDELFLSPRDSTPFEMVLNVSSAPPAAGKPPAIVFYEAVGVDDEIAVGYLGGGTNVIDETELKEQLALAQ